MSDSVRPHRWQPTKLPRPWDSPGKNTGVSCHFLLQCMKVKTESEITQSCRTLHDPMDCSLTGSSVHGIFQARVLEWGAIACSTYQNTKKKKSFWQKYKNSYGISRTPNFCEDNLEREKVVGLIIPDSTSLHKTMAVTEPVLE